MTFYIIGFVFTFAFVESEYLGWWERGVASLFWPLTLGLAAGEVYEKIMKEDEE